MLYSKNGSRIKIFIFLDFLMKMFKRKSMRFFSQMGNAQGSVKLCTKSTSPPSAPVVAAMNAMQHETSLGYLDTSLTPSWKLFGIFLNPSG